MWNNPVRAPCPWIIIDNNDKSIIIDFYRKSILIEVTTFFFIDFYRLISEMDIHRWLISITINRYRLSVYRLTTTGICDRFWEILVENYSCLVDTTINNCRYLMETLIKTPLFVITSQKLLWPVTFAFNRQNGTDTYPWELSSMAVMLVMYFFSCRNQFNQNRVCFVCANDQSQC